VIVIVASTFFLKKHRVLISYHRNKKATRKRIS